MSVAYELWSSGRNLATYKTLGQALLGALWRSKKLKRYVYVYKKVIRGQSIAAVTADDDYAKF